MNARTLVIVIGCLFFLCAAAYIGFRIERSGTLRINHLIYFALAGYLAVDFIKSGGSSRWAVIIVSALYGYGSFASAIYLGPIGLRTTGFTLVGTGFSLCAVSLLALWAVNCLKSGESDRTANHNGIEPI